MYNFDKEYAVVAASFIARANDGRVCRPTWNVQREDDGKVTVWKQRLDDVRTYDFIGLCDTWDEATRLAGREASHSKLFFRNNGLSCR